MGEVTKIETQPVENLPSVSPMAMIERAIAGGATVEVLDKLMDLKDRHEDREARKAFDRAIAAAKAALPSVRKSRTVDFTNRSGQRTNYSFEDMATISRAVDPVLGEHGLSYRFRTKQEGKTVHVTCVLSHRDGYSEETSLSAQNDESGNKNAIQAVGSTVTYLQRYTLKAALGLASSDDDDGKAHGSQAKAVTEEQFTELRSMIDATGADEDKLLKHFDLNSLHDMTAPQFDQAMAMLRRKLKDTRNA